MARSKIYEYEGEEGTSKSLSEMFGVSSATIRRKGVVKDEAFTLSTTRDELLAKREASIDELDIAECNAFLQIKNIRNKRLM